MKLGNDNSSGFQLEQVNLAEMKEVMVKIIFIGDGMSGKTQILITFGKLLLDYLQKIHQNSTETRFKPFLKWARNFGFLLKYGKIKWNIMEVSLDTETIGLEDFEFVFPYVWQGQTYKIRLQGKDVGGQNIFDHFRAVIGRLVKPKDYLFVVFDKSRQLSCFNSIDQVRTLLEEKTEFPQIIYCANKIDLVEHIQEPTWRDSVSKSIIEEIEKVNKTYKGEYSIPSLVGENDNILEYKIENNTLSFPDLEAIVYNSIRGTDSKYKTELMSEVNLKALSREIAAQISYNIKAEVLETQEDKMGELWENLKKKLFQFRPLAMQYSISPIAAPEDDDFEVYDRIRENWAFFGVELPLNEEMVRFAIEKAGCAEELLTELGSFFDTNALNGIGILEMIDHMIRQTLIKLKSSSDKKPVRRQLKRF
jgi:GTPase SAR1 family protein